MTRMVFTGFDSAWTRGNRGAIAHVIVDESGIMFPPPRSASFLEALNSIKAVGAGAALHVIAIDQPLIVPNATGSRPVEGVFRPILGRMGGAIQPSSRGRVGMFDDCAPIWQFMRALHAPIDPMLIPGALAGRLAFEVYPVAAQIGFATGSGELKRLHKYNPGRRRTFTTAGWQALHLIMEGAATRLELHEMARWFQTSSVLEPSKADQERVDAAICCLVAWNWWRNGLNASALVGNTSTGYIVTPASHFLLAHLLPAAAARGVPIASSLPEG